ncbi:MAG: PDZ domain-containing protein [Clostridia bacterium]|nr:PDZ domain-containing protein [Clostridia bacterium]
MRVEYIKVNKSKKLISLLVILFLLILAYVTLELFDVRETVSSKIEFAKNTDNYEFVLGGEACGIKLLANGVLVVEVDNIKSGVKIGDVILKVDDTLVDTNKEIIEYVNKDEIIKKKKVLLTIKRDENTITKEIELVHNKVDNIYELGLWVKDSSAGVGMVTFYELTTNSFAALGHGITETKNNIILPMLTGAIVRAKINSINKAKPKLPGDLRATIYKEVLGQIRKNTGNGLYGTMENKEKLTEKKELIEVASKNEIKVGKAYIYCTLDKEVEKFEAEIENVLLDSSGNKNMIIKITDEKLLKETGGIVQGMSGSPIVQNGKLIGAVTHVFLNNPKKGYGSFIENMIEDMKTI